MINRREFGRLTLGGSAVAARSAEASRSLMFPIVLPKGRVPARYPIGEGRYLFSDVRASACEATLNHLH